LTGCPLVPFKICRFSQKLMLFFAVAAGVKRIAAAFVVISGEVHTSCAILARSTTAVVNIFPTPRSSPACIAGADWSIESVGAGPVLSADVHDDVVSILDYESSVAEIDQVFAINSSVSVRAIARKFSTILTETILTVGSSKSKGAAARVLVSVHCSASSSILAWVGITGIHRSLAFSTSILGGAGAHIGVSAVGFSTAAAVLAWASIASRTICWQTVVTMVLRSLKDVNV